MSYLDEAITLQRNELDLLPQEHPDRPTSLSRLATFLHSRFQQLGRLPDLEEAISLQRNALELRSEEDPERPASLGYLAFYLYIRFKQLGMLSDLDEALVLERRAYELYPLDHPDRAAPLGNIASYLQIRFERLGSLSDLDEALVLQRKVLELRPEGHHYRSVSLGNIASALYSRFKQLGMMSDLEESIALERNTLELRPPGHPERAASLSNLASSLHSRFEQLGRLSDLEEALVLQRDTLELRPEGHPQRPSSLDDLALSLHTRFQQFATLSDLEEALSLERNSLQLLPLEHPGRPPTLSNLAGFLHDRFQKLAKLSDLEEALALERSSLELRPQGHPGRATSLGNLAHYLRSRFEQLGSLPDLDEAISFARDTLELHAPGHLHRAISLGNLAVHLHTRFKHLGTLSDLDEAISLERGALELRPLGHPYRAHSLGNLARYFHARFKHSNMGDNNDLQEVFDLYSQLDDVCYTASAADLECSKGWIIAAEEHQHSTIVLAHQTFSHLCARHLTALPPLARYFGLFKRLMVSTAVDAFSACIRYGDHAKGVELLEQNRGVFWNQLLRLRTPLDDVLASGDTGKKLGVKFTQLTSLLRSVLDAPPNAESQHNWAFHFNIQLQDIITEIRQLPSLSRFLLPLLFSDLRLAASDGPIVIVNASQYGCDALVIFHDKCPVHVGLPITRTRVSQLSSELRFLGTSARFRDVTKELLVILRELWDTTVFPIVKVLQEYHPHQSRIWWCPTAEFSLLPLHAAGSFRKGEPMLSDLYISSYTPTLTALIHARRQRSLDSTAEPCYFLVVGQAEDLDDTSGEGKLPSVETELTSVSQCVAPVATLTRVQDRDATVAKVAKALETNQFVHLTCRGIPDRQRPFASGFALGDGLMTVEDMMRYDLPNARFAYMSAGHTTVGDAQNPDEVVHLTAAMQFAGFRSVVGTMWGVDDKYASEVASQFYDCMLRESDRLHHTRAALALHETMVRLRPRIPLDQQIAYVHVGA